MELTVFERLIILNILPAQGNYTTLKTVRELKEALAFDDEAEALDFHEGYRCRECEEPTKKPIGELPGLCHECGGGLAKTGEMFWNPDAEQPKDIEINSRANRIISDILESLDKEEKLTNDHYSLYQKFVGDEE